MDFMWIVIAVVVVLYAVIEWIIHYIPYAQQRDYIKMEMKRAGNDAEYHHWEKELKDLHKKHPLFP